MIKRNFYIIACLLLVFQYSVDLSAQDLTISGDVKMNLSGSVKVRLSGTSSSFNLEDDADFVDAANTSVILEGDLDNNTSFVTFSGNLIFDGSASQNISASAAVNNLTVSNNNSLSIDGSVLVLSQLNFEQSTINTTADDDLTLSEGVTFSGVGASGYVNGPLRVRADGTSNNVLSFPIGKGGDYLPVRFGFDQTGSTGLYVAEANTSSIPSNSLASTLQSVSTARYWSLRTFDNFSNAYIELPVDSEDGVSQASLVRIAREGNNTWQDLGGINLSAIPGTVRSSVAFTELGNFIIAAASPNNNAPSISSISPGRGQVSDVVTITGSNLGSSTGTVKFGNVTVDASDIISWTDSQIEVRVPDGLSPGNSVNIEITVNGAGSPINFSFVFVVTDGTVDCNAFSITNFPKNSSEITVNQTNTFTAEVTDASLVSTAEFYYRGISQEAWEGPFSASSSGNDFSYDLDIPNSVGDVGIEYYFVFKLNGCDDVQSNVAHAYLYLPFGVIIDGLTPGNTAGDYNLFSIPLDLDNSNVTSVLDELGTYDKTKWRLFRVQEDAYQEFNGSNFSFEPGKGYLLIFDETPEGGFESTSGSTVNVTKENPFQMSLQQGWNMIASPYPFTIQWQDVLTANGLGTLNDFFFYTSSGYSAGNGELDLFGGAIWFAENATNVSVPVLKSNAGGRIAGGNGLQENFGENNWEIPLVLTDDNGSELKGGIGMNEDAALSKDRFDGMRPPASNFQSTFHFLHEEYFYPYFLKDVVPNSNQHEWAFEITPATASSALTITWDRDLVNELNLPLYLLEQNTGIIVDMSVTDSYAFPATTKNDFKIVFGSNEALVKANSLIGEVFPNPASTMLKLPVSVPLHTINTQLNIAVYNTTGQKVLSIQKNKLYGGYQEIELPLANSIFSKGVYLAKVELENDGIVKKKHVKFLVK